MKWRVLIGDCGPSVVIEADGLRCESGMLVFWKRVLIGDCAEGEVVTRAFPPGRWWGVAEEE